MNVMKNKTSLIIAISTVVIILLIVVSVIVAILFGGRQESASNEYASLKKDMEAVKQSFIDLQAQGERYVGSIVLNREGISLEKARLDAIQVAHEELESRVNVLEEREISDPTLEQQSNDVSEKASRAADEFMALVFSATAFVECISAPIGAPNEPEDLESDRQDLINCRDAAKQVSTIESRAGRDYGEPISENADYQLSLYEDLEQLGDFSSDENLKEYGEIDEKIFNSARTSLSIEQPKDVITAQNEASDAYNGAYSNLMDNIDEKLEPKPSDE